MADNKVRIVYDKQCPACSLYCEIYQTSAETQEVTLLDARDESDLMTRITSLGLDIDEGMVVEIGDELHYGADAIQALASAAEPRGLFNRVSKLLFQNRRMARVLYPILRSIRNFLLKVLGVGRINNLERPGKEKF